MTLNLQSTLYICACALIAYIASHSTGILQHNSWTERSGLKIFVHFVAECLFDVSKVVFMFNNHKVTMKFTQKLVSLLFWVSICLSSLWCVYCSALFWKDVRCAFQYWRYLIQSKLAQQRVSGQFVCLRLYGPVNTIKVMLCLSANSWAGFIFT